LDKRVERSLATPELAAFDGTVKAFYMRVHEISPETQSLPRSVNTR
jgi:hypothetical protein